MQAETLEELNQNLQEVVDMLEAEFIGTQNVNAGTIAIFKSPGHTQRVIAH